MSKIQQSLERRYPGDGLRRDFRTRLCRACEAFLASGHADRKFESELTGTSNAEFWSRVSEALVFDRIKHLNFLPRPVAGTGPDFLLTNGDIRIWVEVVCPEPKRISEDWLRCRGGSSSVPHEAILSRWTSVIKDKTEKLVGAFYGEDSGYLQKGHVANDDVYVIAVNGCQLRNGPFSAFHGISQFPNAVEAVFPIGPQEIRLDRKTLEVIDSGHQERFGIQKTNGSQIPTHAFLDPRYERVSAIWALDFNGSSAVGGSEPSAIIHNPYAINQLPMGFLPADEEFVAEPLGEEFLIIKHIQPKL